MIPFTKKLKNDPTERNKLALIKTLSRMLAARQIDADQFGYLTPTDSHPCQFYLLPKIHKPGNPGSPIVIGLKHPA